MRSFTSTAIFALIATVAASPMSRRALALRDNNCIVQTVDNPSADQVKASIQQWTKDVEMVNTFLDTIGQISDTETIVNHTKAVQVYAQDEPCQLATLTSALIGLDTQASDCAVNDLNNVFGTFVLNNLAFIIQENADPSSTPGILSDITNIRCCNVLPDVDLLWLDSSDSYSLAGEVLITAPRSQACSTIDCSGLQIAASTCRSDDNGTDG